MKYVVPLLALSFGCNTFTTVEEACEGDPPGADVMSDAAARELASRLNCYRRLAKGRRIRIQSQVQEATEAHTSYLELNPTINNFFGETPGADGFTGSNVIDRLAAANYSRPNNSGLIQYITAIVDPDGSVDGADHVDFWWDDPFARTELIQNQLIASGIDTSQYVFTAADGVETPVSLASYTFIFNAPNPALAEIPRVYPRNGQLDAPGSYVHLSQSDGDFEEGVTYGYPITFTVGTTETNLVVDQAFFGVKDGDGLPHRVLTGQGVTLQNSVIVVPDEPLAAGQTYVAIVTLTTSQGTRRAKTEFTVGSNNRFIPNGVGARMFVEPPTFARQPLE